MSNKKEKKEAALLLSSYLDTLGFNNGDWEFNFNNKLLTMDNAETMWMMILHQFFSLGGIKHINISKWIPSDDTLLMKTTAEALIEKKTYQNKYLEILDELKDEKLISGLSTIDSLDKLKRGIPIKFSINHGGNGAAIRTGPIGLFYDDIDTIIEESLNNSLLTHYYPLGCLGGVSVALFTHWAYKSVDPWLWIDKFLKLEDKITKLMEEKMNPDKLNSEDKKLFYSGISFFFNTWREYEETRLQKIKYRHLDIFSFPRVRIIDMFEFFPSIFCKGRQPKMICRWDKVGASGLDVLLWVYDSLLLSIVPTQVSEPKNRYGLVLLNDNVTYSWETFVVNCALFFGDNDSTGAVGGMIWGALNGFKDVEKDNMKQLKYYNELKKIADKL